MNSLIIFLALVVVGGGFLIWLSARRKRELQGIIPNKFSDNEKVFAADGLSLLVVSEKLKEICVIRHKTRANFDAVLAGKGRRSDAHICQTYHFRDILEAKIIEDGVSVTSVKRGSQVASAALGVLALGPLGGVVGGLSGKTESVKRTNQITLRILLNDTEWPVFEIDFIANTQGEAATKWKRDSFVYKQAIAQARQWHGVLKVIMSQIDKEEGAIGVQIDEPKSSDTVSSKHTSDVANLEKLAHLFEKGLLTEEEFEGQKKNFLS